MTLLRAEFFHLLAGVIFSTVAGAVAWDRTHPQRRGSTVFWLVLGVIFAAGRVLPPALVGAAVVGLALLAAAGWVAPPERTAAAVRMAGPRVLGLAALLPVFVVLGTFTLERLQWGEVRFVLKAEASLVALGLACLLTLALACRALRASPVVAVREGGGLLQLLGWSLLLPQALAGLGGVMARAGVGEWIATHVAAWLPLGLPWVAVLAYCGAMALFTIVLGNAFAAFPVVTLGIGLPFIVQQHGGDPAIMAALGMLSGYCGTLVTPMAANFNLVPALLLELPDRRAVIRAQVPMAAAIFGFNVAAMGLLVFRFGP